MTPHSFGARPLALPIATALAATSLVLMSVAPAHAAKTSFTNSQTTYSGTGSWAQTNATAITINDNSAASAYPAEITVDHAATIADVDVTLLGVTHDWATDLDVMVVGPGGQQVILLSDSGSSNDFEGANLRFSDGGASLPASDPIPSGLYDPVNSGLGDPFADPAPVTTDNTSLSVFNGTNAAGTWRLFVMDDENGVNGSMTGGWRLTFNLDGAPYPSTIDVGGLPPISDVNVHINGITTGFVGDINLLLVGPGGQQSYLMGDVSTESSDLTNASFTIDDEAPTPFPGDGELLVPGSSYQPTLLGDVEDFPSPAPVTTGNIPLLVFDGLSPNGQWRLFPLDDNGGASGPYKFTSWSLDFTWSDIASPSGLVNVNGGAATTSTPSVTLNVNATDPAPASGVTLMRFSNDGTTFSAYQAYAVTAPWTLTSGDGAKTVYAQFKDGDGNESAVVTDTITLALPDTKSPTATKLTPKKNAKGVKVTTKVKIKASEALKGSTVTAKTVFLKAKGSSKKVKAAVTYNATGKTIVLKPKSSLKTGTKYTVTVTTKVKDVAGNAFDAKPAKAGAQALKFSFTTG